MQGLSVIPNDVRIGHARDELFAEMCEHHIGQSCREPVLTSCDYLDVVLGAPVLNLQRQGNALVRLPLPLHALR